MPPALIMSGQPSNVFLPNGSRAAHVTADLYGIADRIRELDPRLRIDLLEHVNGTASWGISEETPAGIDLVMLVGPGNKFDALDGRVVRHLQWLMSVSPQQRARELIREIDAANAAAVEASREKLYETMAPVIYRGLHEGGFIQTPRPESFNKLNKTARRAGRSI